MQCAKRGANLIVVDGERNERGHDGLQVADEWPALAPEGQVALVVALPDAAVVHHHHVEVVRRLERVPGAVADEPARNGIVYTCTLYSFICKHVLSTVQYCYIPLCKHEAQQTSRQTLQYITYQGVGFVYLAKLDTITIMNSDVLPSIMSQLSRIGFMPFTFWNQLEFMNGKPNKIQ